jgi:hypothetical protein
VWSPLTGFVSSLLALQVSVAMVSKSRKQRQRLIAAEGQAPQPVSEKKSVHLKKVRQHVRHKHKIRLGMTSADIYEGFEDKAGVKWRCQTCGLEGRVIGFCSHCAVSGTATTGEDAPLPPALGKISKTAKKAATAGKKKKITLGKKK